MHFLSIFDTFFSPFFHLPGKAHHIPPNGKAGESLTQSAGWWGNMFPVYVVTTIPTSFSTVDHGEKKKHNTTTKKKNSPKNHRTLQNREVWMSFLQGSGISKPLVLESHDSQGAFWLLVAPRDNSTDPCWCHWLQSPRKDHKESMKPIPPPWDQTSSKTWFSSCQESHRIKKNKIKKVLVYITKRCKLQGVVFVGVVA